MINHTNYQFFLLFTSSYYQTYKAASSSAFLLAIFQYMSVKLSWNQKGICSINYPSSG